MPFTIIADGAVVHLIGGEDIRYSIHAAGLVQQLAALLLRCDGTSPLPALLADIPEADRIPIEKLVERMYAERILIDGPVEATFTTRNYRPVAEGRGPLVERLSASAPDGEPLAILCQDSLDHHTALTFNHRCRREGKPFLWVTAGPASRGYVSPLFLPDAGPCLACLLGQFQRLSPAPQLYAALIQHGTSGGAFPPTPFPPEGWTVLEQIARWKVETARREPVPPALFQLHVLELETMEVSLHRVFTDPTCPECADARLA